MQQATAGRFFAFVRPAILARSERQTDITSARNAITPMSTASTLTSRNEPAASTPGVVNAASAPSASVQVFGLSHWKIAASTNVGGASPPRLQHRPSAQSARRDTGEKPRRCNGGLRAAMAIGGRFLRARPNATSMAGKPTETPSICGSVRANPNAAPDAFEIILFGPGVKEPTNANTTKDRSFSGNGTTRLHVGRKCATAARAGPCDALHATCRKQRDRA
jgi:hypothetical protein